MKVVLYKWEDCQVHRYGWSMVEIWDDWNHVYSDPYYVQLPEGFYLDVSMSQVPMIFKKGDDHGYDLTSSTTCKSCVPVLVGSGETIRLKVIGLVSDADDDVDTMDFSDLRAAAGLTQKEVMERLGIPLITQSFWENGRRVPPDYVLNLFRYWLRKEGFFIIPFFLFLALCNVYIFFIYLCVICEF